MAPVVQDAPPRAALGVLDVPAQELPDRPDVFFLLDGFEVHHLPVAADVEILVLVQHVGNAAGHARGKVASGLADNHHAAAGHVFATVISHALHHRVDAAVPDAEALAGDAPEIAFAGGCAVQGYIADKDVFLRHKGRGPRRVDNDLAAGKALADVIVGVPFQGQGDAPGDERAETHPGRPVEMHPHCILRQSRGAVAFGDFVAQDGSRGTVGIPDGQDDVHRFPGLERLFAQGHQRGHVQ